MKRELSVTHAGVERQVTIEDGRVSIDGKSRDVDAKQIRPGTWSIVLDGKQYLVDLDKRAALNGKVAASVGASEAVLEIEDLAKRKVGGGAGKAKAHAKGETLRAPIAGKVVKVLVEVGEQVAPGHAVIVLEAMKMENEIVSERGGTVKVVHKQAGQAVDTGDTLVELE
ncbi:MAG: hypothetical protein QM831_34260 [Kofleriaceae bacterium]